MSDQQRDDLSLGEHISAGAAENAGKPSDDTSQEEEGYLDEHPQPAPRDPVQGQR